MKYTIEYAQAVEGLKAEGLTPSEVVRLSFIRDTFGKDAEAVKDYAEKHNKKAMAEAIASCFNGDSFKWDFFIEGVSYSHIDHEVEDDTKAISMKVLKVSDIFCKKSTKNSNKKELPLVIMGMLNQYGHNLGIDFLKGKEGVNVQLKEKAVAELKLYTKYTNAPKCFFENATSNKGHERQLQEFFNTFYGENQVIATKHYVDHLKESFIVATKKGYADKSEIAFLQLICNEAYNCKHGKKYNFKSSLTCHAEKKDKKDK